MTVSIVVASHGELAAGIVNSATMLVGPPTDLVAVGLFPGQGQDELIDQYSKAVTEFGADETLFLVDLFGGTPYNAAARFVAGKGNMDIVSGISLPMLVEVIAKRMGGANLAELIDTAKTAGAAGIKQFQEVWAAQQAASATDEDEMSDEL